MSDDLPDHSNISVIKAVDESGNLVTVLVDASGAIISVMKGDYTGALKSLAVDSAGRMITVIRDPANDRYLAVDSNGYLGAILKAAADVNVQGSVPVDQNATEREMQGKEGATLRTVAVDSGGRIIMVPRGDSGYYLAVDSDGNIVSVMKGDYAGALKTLSVDDEGRIQAVLTDPEDVFGNPNYIGAGELAARLGSIKWFEKRGEVVFMDDFEPTTLKWIVSGSGTGYSVARSNTRARSGDYSLKFTTGNAEDNYALGYYHMFYPSSTRFAIECAFAFGSDLKRIDMGCNLYNGTTRYKANVFYYPQDNDLKIDTYAHGYYTVDANLDLWQQDSTFHIWKLVFDVSTKKYVELFVDGNEYDISAYSIAYSSVSISPHLSVRLNINNNAAGNHYAYIDDVIVTQNEP